MPRTLGPLAALALLAGAACAGGSTPSLATAPAPTTTRIRSDGDVLELRTTRNDPRAEHPLPANADRVWHLLPGAFDSLGIRVELLDSQARVIGNRSLVVRRMLGGVRLSQYMDCGERLGVRNADSYELTLDIGTQVRPAGADSSTLVTLVQGTARPMNVSGHTIPCGSTGLLERRLGELVQAALR